MKINKFQSVLPVLTEKHSVLNNNIKNLNTKSVELNNFKFYSSMYPVSFYGSQKTPLTDEDYQNAKNNFRNLYKKAVRKHPNYVIELSMLDLSKLNGLQKGIKVFEGLTMEEIGFVLKNPVFLLNRGCDNNCAHCGYMATPYSKSTLDRMSYEDFISVVDGINQLNANMDNKVSVCPDFRTFLDSDCMNIELTDKEGNIYDYVDCLKVLKKNSISPPLFDTTGWNPNSAKMQKRAEKFVDYVTNPENGRTVGAVNMSFNPYHSLYRKSLDAKHHFRFREAKELESIYVNRIANMLFTFTPILNSNVRFGFLTRAKMNDSHTLLRLHDKIIKQLANLYKQDLSGEQRYVQSEEQMQKYILEYDSCLYGTEYGDKEILPWGRAESLFLKSKKNLASRKEQVKNKAQNGNVENFQRGINPNGSVILIRYDVSVNTDLELNFANKGKPVKPFANELEDYVYKTNKGK